MKTNEDNYNELHYIHTLNVVCKVFVSLCSARNATRLQLVVHVGGILLKAGWEWCKIFFVKMNENTNQLSIYLIQTNLYVCQYVHNEMATKVLVSNTIF